MKKMEHRKDQQRHLQGELFLLTGCAEIILPATVSYGEGGVVSME